MKETIPSSENEPPPQPTDEPNESLIPSFARERIEQLLAVVAELEAANDSLQQQLTSALSANHTPLMRVGERPRRVTLAAKSLGSMYLEPQMDRSGSTDVPTGLWLVRADDRALTEYLPEQEAWAALIRYEAEWEKALQPPAKK